MRPEYMHELWVGSLTILVFGLAQEDVSVANPVGSTKPAAQETAGVLDTDGDGQSDEAETLAGTNPADPLSVFKVLDLELIRDVGVQIQWSSVTGKFYSVYRDTSLEWNAPELLTNAVAATPPVNAFTDKSLPDGTACYYKVSIYDSIRTPELVHIPAGDFQMGDSSDEGYFDELPAHEVVVSGFYMDNIEVSKGLWDEVALWAVSHGYDITTHSGLGKSVHHPAHSVTWYEAVKWCNARSEKEGRTPCYYTDADRDTVYRTGTLDLSNDCVKWNATGYRLPTEAEWEKAARGGLSEKLFPWGDTISHTLANYYSSISYSYDISPTRGYHPMYNEEWPYTSPVGGFSAYGYGLFDMAGNQWEWCWDWYDADWYSNADATQTDCQGPASGMNRLLRGGSWFDDADFCRSTYRGSDEPSVEGSSVGFRCVRL